MGSKTRKCRRLTLLDGMILIAATAGGFSLSRAMFPDLRLDTASPKWEVICGCYLVAGPLILVEMIGFIIIRLQQPRPRFRRIMVQPGTVGCVTALGFSTLYGATFGYWAERESILAWITREGVVHYFVPPAVGSAVAIAWVILAVSHRWRHERGWIDTLGMVLGCYWIGSALTVFSETLQTVR